MASSTDDNITMGCAALTILFVLAIAALKVWVVVHFIRKFW